MEHYLYYSPTTFLFSSAWKAFCLNTCVSHSFVSSAYISLSKTDLFFIWKGILPLPLLFVPLPSFVLPHGSYSHLTEAYFLFMISASLGHKLHKIPSVCLFDSWLFCCTSSVSGFCWTNEWISSFLLHPKYNPKQVRLPATMQANTREAGGDIKESGLFSGASNLEDGGLMSQSTSPHFSRGRDF